MLFTYIFIESWQNIISNSEKIPGSVGEKIKQFSTQGILTKTLATIKTDVNIRIELEEMNVSTPNINALSSLFDELEFRVLKNRVFNQFDTKPTPKKSQQLNVFETQKKRIFNALKNSSSDSVIKFKEVLKKIIDGK